MEVLPISERPSSNEDTVTNNSKIDARASFETNTPVTPFDNDEQAAYYISNTLNIPSPYDLCYYNKMYMISPEFNYFPPNSNLQTTTEQLSIPLDISSDISLALPLDNNNDISLTIPLAFQPESSICEYIKHLYDIEEKTILSQFGYTPDDVQPIIGDTVQGQLLKYRSMVTDEYVAIKRIDKHLFKERVNKISENGFNFCVEKNIVNEARILKYLTVDNKSTDYVIQYVDFVESDTDFYLVMEYIDGKTDLKQFIQIAHHYMLNNKLDLKHYQTIIKYVFWQLSVVIHFLHNDMKCCHLDLNLENIMLKNADFTERDDGSVVINTNISVKLCDFGRAEIFNPFEDNFNCVKLGSILGEIQYQSPKQLNEQVYDARKTDNWQLGMMLFECIVGKPLYDKIQGNDCWATMNNKLNKYVMINGKILPLLNGLLNVNQKKRFNTFEILQNKWFKSYYKRYQAKIEKKSIAQNIKLQNGKDTFDNFKIYSYSS